MSGHGLQIFEYVIFEQRAPYRLVAFGQVANGQDCVIECVFRFAEIGWRVPPPVIDQHVEWREPFDMMPIKRRHKDRVAGIELRHHAMSQRVAKTRMRGKVGMMEIDHADGASRGRVLYGARVKIAELLGRKQSEAPAPYGAHRKVVRYIGVRGYPCRASDPDARNWMTAAKRQPVVRSEEHTSELQSQSNLVCRLLLEKKKKKIKPMKVYE